MRYITLILLLFVLGGCASLAPILKAGAEVNDEAIEAAAFTLCYAASVGSMRRSFTPEEREQLWATFQCSDKGN